MASELAKDNAPRATAPIDAPTLTSFKNPRRPLLVSKGALASVRVLEVLVTVFT
jgi:hypothetical protein